MKRRKIGMKALAGLFIMAVNIILVTGITIDIQHKKNKMSEYNEMAFSYAWTAAEYIDGDKVRQYLETGDEDDYYRGIKNLLEIMLRQTNMKYCSVFVPYDDGVVYVWDVGDEQGVRPLGYREPYMEGGKEIFEQISRGEYPNTITTARDEEYGYIASAYVPVFDSAGSLAAVAGVDLSMPGIRKVLFQFLVTIILSVFCVTSISMVVFYIFIKRNIIEPIGRLDQAAKSMASNMEEENTFCVDIHTGDEIEELSNAFVQMDKELRDYIRKLSSVTAEKERIGAELNVATQIQADMLPSIFPPFPNKEEFDIYATMDPAKEVGGDFYDFFMVDDAHLAMVMADVSGKGVPAALFMVIGKTLIKDHTKAGVPLGEVFTEVNRLLCESNKEGLFITAFECVLDLKTGRLEYVNAGHEPAFIAKYGETYEEYKATPQFVLAGFDGMTYKHGEMQLSPGDRIFLFTDGITDAINTDGQLYGMDRLREVLRANSGKSPEELLGVVKQDIDKFVGAADQFDDITMLGLEFKMRKDKITLKAELGLLDTVSGFVDGFMESGGYSGQLRTHVDIAVDEVYTNVCSYAYPDGAGDVTIEIMADGDKLELVFTDSGIEYDPLKKDDPDITVKLEEREIGGLGIFMVKQMMDEMSYCRHDGKNVLRMVKNIGAATESEERK